MTKTELNKCPKVVWAMILTALFTLVVHYALFHQPCNQPHASVDQLRNTFMAGARASELHHAETAHYPQDEWLHQASRSMESGTWKKFLDDFVQKGPVEAPEVTGRVLTPGKGQDSGNESGRL